MRPALLLAIAFSAGSLAASAGPFDQLKGRMKEGLYDYKMEMDMGQVPGMPAGMGKQSMSIQRCLTQQDIDKGNMGRGGGGPGGRGQMPENCDVKDFQMSGNTASYTMVCKPPREMTAENHITFTPDGYKMDMKMNMAMGASGKTMDMTQHMEARYLGPCTK